MSKFLDDEEYTIETRLEAAKMIIEIRDKYIEELLKQLDSEQAIKNWSSDQESSQRMGL